MLIKMNQYCTTPLYHEAITCTPPLMCDLQRDPNLSTSRHVVSSLGRVPLPLTSTYHIFALPITTGYNSSHSHRTKDNAETQLHPEGDFTNLTLCWASSKIRAPIWDHGFGHIKSFNQGFSVPCSGASWTSPVLQKSLHPEDQEVLIWRDPQRFLAMSFVLSLSLFRISKRHKLNQCTSDFDETETWILQAKQRLAWQVEWQCWFCTCLPVSISRSPKERLPKYLSIFVLCEWTSSPCSNYEENVCDACGVVSSFHLTHTTSYTFTIWCAYPACRAGAGIFCQEMFPLSPPGISPLGPGNMSVYHLARNENCRYLLGLDTWCLKEESATFNRCELRPWPDEITNWCVESLSYFKEHSCGQSSHWEIVLVLFWIGV